MAGMDLKWASMDNVSDMLASALIDSSAGTASGRILDLNPEMFAKNQVF